MKEGPRGKKVAVIFPNDLEPKKTADTAHQTALLRQDSDPGGCDASADSFTVEVKIEPAVPAALHACLLPGYLQRFDVTRVVANRIDFSPIWGARKTYRKRRRA